ncbi:MotA/TolQ/ExbB proton channel family protein [Desulfonema ishimotonii]|uniref:MotA/TolQ/ExbB proton channel family protein n=1 Tax=Desulfonema ishimotonii TaxID=45657 RepID=A0A401FZC7_9BACT|nr:MotA/TolQ/ExbB proton channel family protein [Desulfonema ishimotonii]GBC62339.1 MotA/TolQ/ExbB proton channel family protein [Desulfonema ishimotonii]
MGFPDYLADTLEYLNQGGCVLYPLIAVSVWMWYLIIRKLVLLSYWGRQRPGKKKTGQTTEARAVLAEFRENRTADPEWDRRLLQSLVRRRQNELEKHIQTIFVLAAVAPLLGLLGTVTGMISTFEAISRFGTANARALASGISEALITTQAGLIVAVPGLFMGHYIRRRADNIRMRMDRFFLNAGNRL